MAQRRSLGVRITSGAQSAFFSLLGLALFCTANARAAPFDVSCLALSLPVSLLLQLSKVVLALALGSASAFVPSSVRSTAFRRKLSPREATVGVV
jgi:hypothetical protein